MLEGLFGGDAGFGVVDEYPAEKIEELLVEFRVGWNDVLCCGLLATVFARRGDQGDQRVSSLGIVRYIDRTACEHTGSVFIALTYFRDALDVSLFG